MKTKYLTALLVLSLTACTETPVSTAANSCSDPLAETLVSKIITEEVEKAVSADAKEEEFILHKVGIGKIRNAISRLKFKLDDIRTTEKSDKSRRLMCAATLKLELPDGYLEQAKKANKEIEDDDTGDFLEAHFKRDGAYFVREIIYSVQPTDNNEKLFAVVHDLQPFTKPLYDLVSLYLMQPALVEGKAELARQARQDLEKAKKEHKKKLAQINQFWQSLPQVLQDDWQSEQTAWNQEHQEQCTQAEDDISDGAGETASLAREERIIYCKINAINERMAYLKKQKQELDFQGNNAAPPEEDEAVSEVVAG